MRSVPFTRRSLLAVVCLLAAASAAAANPPGRTRVALYPPVPSYYPGVYAYPQVVTTPVYPVYPTYPSPYYGYPTGWSGSYYYNPGSFYYSYSPRWGTSFYYTNPSFYYRYRVR